MNQFVESSHSPYKISRIIIPILKLRKLSPIKVKIAFWVYAVFSSLYLNLYLFD